MRTIMKFNDFSRNFSSKMGEVMMKDDIQRYHHPLTSKLINSKISQDERHTVSLITVAKENKTKHVAFERLWFCFSPGSLSHRNWNLNPFYGSNDPYTLICVRDFLVCSWYRVKQPCSSSGLVLQLSKARVQWSVHFQVKISRAKPIHREICSTPLSSCKITKQYSHCKLFFKRFIFIW